MLSTLVNFLAAPVLKILDIISGLILGFIYEKQKRQIPPITNEILVKSACALASDIANKKLSSVEVVEAFITRIKEVNPILNCVVDERFDDAIKDAKKVDALLAVTNKTVQQLREDTPYLGVPFTIKDSFNVKGLRNTVGLYYYKDNVSQEDADVVVLMKQAGAIPLALTNVPELCMWYETSNVIYGRTNNAYHTGRMVGGSSGGEACLLSCGGSPFGIGSDIGGSIRMPAHFNGIFGHKNSPDIVSNRGQLPTPSTHHNKFLSTGPLCRYSSDLIPFYKVLAAQNRRRLQLDKKVHLQSIRYFFMQEISGSPLLNSTDTDIQQALLRAVKHMENTFDIDAHEVDLAEFHSSFEIFDALMVDEDDNEPSFCEELAGRKGRVNIWLEALRWFIGRSHHTYPALGYGFSLLATPSKDSPSYKKYKQMHSTLQNKIEEMLGDDGVLFFPTHPHPALYHHQAKLKPFNISYTAIFNVLGLPGTHCPLGLNASGLPIGIQVIGGRNQDHLCLAVAAELDKAFGGWVPPCKVQC